MNKDNRIKAIKCGDIEIPIEYLKQTTVNVNGDDYIKLQQENKILKENAENNDKVVDKVNWENQLLKKENKQLKVTIDKAIEKLNSFIGCCKAEKLESGSDYLHHQYWNMFENFNKKIKDILKEVSK